MIWESSCSCTTRAAGLCDKALLRLGHLMLGHFIYHYLNT